MYTVKVASVAEELQIKYECNYIKTDHRTIKFQTTNSPSSNWQKFAKSIQFVE